MLFTCLIIKCRGQEGHGVDEMADALRDGTLLCTSEVCGCSQDKKNHGVEAAACAFSAA